MQSRAGVWCQLCVSLLCFLGEPWGSARLAGNPHSLCCGLAHAASQQEAWRTFLVLLGRAESFKVFQNEPAAGCQMLFLICVIRTVVIYLQLGYDPYGKSGEQLWSFPFKFFLCSVGNGIIDDQGASKRHSYLLCLFVPGLRDFCSYFLLSGQFLLVVEAFPGFSTPPWAKRYTMSLLPGLAFEHLIFKLQVFLLS